MLANVAIVDMTLVDEILVILEFKMSRKSKHFCGPKVLSLCVSSLVNLAEVDIPHTNCDAAVFSLAVVTVHSSQQT